MRLAPANARASMLFTNPIESYLEKIRQCLLVHAQQKNNQPENFAVIFEGWDLLLSELRGPEVVALTPVLLELQRQHESESTPQSLSLHQLILALFMRIAVGVDSPDLLGALSQVYSAREEKGSLDSYTVLDVQTGKAFL